MAALLFVEALKLKKEITEAEAEITLKKNIITDFEDKINRLRLNQQNVEQEVRCLIQSVREYQGELKILVQCIKIIGKWLNFLDEINIALQRLKNNVSHGSRQFGIINSNVVKKQAENNEATQCLVNSQLNYWVTDYSNKRDDSRKLANNYLQGKMKNTEAGITRLVVNLLHDASKLEHQNELKSKREEIKHLLNEFEKQQLHYDKLFKNKLLEKQKAENRNISAKSEIIYIESFINGLRICKNSYENEIIKLKEKLRLHELDQKLLMFIPPYSRYF